MIRRPEENIGPRMLGGQPGVIKSIAIVLSQLGVAGY